MVYERINLAIEKHGLKQKAVAERIGVSEQVLSAMLSGRRKISVDEFFNICMVLGETPSNLYGFQSDDKPA
ncbi:MAG: helix-turn-helix domain-containing protein [Clostridiales bacterium]|nr:helix-turn-helix domain-containing protein [Clostridiales bacterium]MDY4200468.1 helix-turn-helix transcriptional regulator [Candidatus Fimadaptatus sp.]